MVATEGVVRWAVTPVGRREGEARVAARGMAVTLVPAVAQEEEAKAKAAWVVG